MPLGALHSLQASLFSATFLFMNSFSITRTLSQKQLCGIRVLKGWKSPPRQLVSFCSNGYKGEKTCLFS